MADPRSTPVRAEMSPASDADVGSVGDFMDRLNRELGLDLPVRFPASTALGALWAQPVTVVASPQGGMLYHATAPLTLEPGVIGQLWIDVYG